MIRSRSTRTHNRMEASIILSLYRSTPYNGGADDMVSLYSDAQYNGGADDKESLYFNAP